MNPITPHLHNDTDSPKLYAGEALINSPQDALTSKSVATLSFGGSNDLKTADAAIISNAITRLNELEVKLQALGILK